MERVRKSFRRYLGQKSNNKHLNIKRQKCKNQSSNRVETCKKHQFCVYFVLGLYKIFDEILVNAADHMTRDKVRFVFGITVYSHCHVYYYVFSSDQKKSFHMRRTIFGWARQVSARGGAPAGPTPTPRSKRCLAHPKIVRRHWKLFFWLLLNT